MVGRYRVASQKGFAPGASRPLLGPDRTADRRSGAVTNRADDRVPGYYDEPCRTGAVYRPGRVPRAGWLRRPSGDGRTAVERAGTKRTNEVER